VDELCGAGFDQLGRGYVEALTRGLGCDEASGIKKECQQDAPPSVRLALVEVLNVYSNFGRTATDLGKVLALKPDGPPPRSDKPHQRQHRLRSDQINQFQIDYLSGLALRELAKRYEINRDTVNDLARRLGLPKRHPLLDAEEVTKAAELYLEGLSHVNIAPLFGVNASTIRNVLLKRGMKMRDPHGRER
jgi:hypothetical protein